MSAFQMSDSAFATLAAASGAPTFCRYALAKAFHDANADSMEYRYGSRAWGEDGVRPVFQGAKPREIENDYALLKLAHCYNYQSCEDPCFDETEAYGVLCAIIESACARLGVDEDQARSAREYKEARWG
jgi:hypothetical protein